MIFELTWVWVGELVADRISVQRKSVAHGFYVIILCALFLSFFLFLFSSLPSFLRSEVFGVGHDQTECSFVISQLGTPDWTLEILVNFG